MRGLVVWLTIDYCIDYFQSILTISSPFSFPVHSQLYSLWVNGPPPPPNRMIMRMRLKVIERRTFSRFRSDLGKREQVEIWREYYLYTLCVHVASLLAAI